MALHRKRMHVKLASAVVLALILAATSVNGALSVTFGVISPPNPGDTEYGYAIDLAPFTDEIVTGDFFRVYDFAGYVPGSIFAISGWTGSVSLVNPPPLGIVLLHGDDPTLDNLTFTYTESPPIVAGTSGLDLGPFEALSTIGPANTTLKDFAASITDAEAFNGVNGTKFVSEGAVTVPAPEPTSVSLLALTVPLLLIRRRPGAAWCFTPVS